MNLLNLEENQIRGFIVDFFTNLQLGLENIEARWNTIPVNERPFNQNHINSERNIINDLRDRLLEGEENGIELTGDDIIEMIEATNGLLHERYQVEENIIDSVIADQFHGENEADFDNKFYLLNAILFIIDHIKENLLDDEDQDENSVNKIKEVLSELNYRLRMNTIPKLTFFHDLEEQIYNFIYLLNYFEDPEHSSDNSSDNSSYNSSYNGDDDMENQEAEEEAEVEPELPPQGGKRKKYRKKTKSNKKSKKRKTKAKKHKKRKTKTMKKRKGKKTRKTL